MTRIFFLLLIGLLHSCSDRYEYFEKINEPPSLFILKKNRATVELTDSLKTSIQAYYPIKLILTDSTSEIASLKYKINSGQGKMYYKDQEVINANLNTHNQNISLKWVPASLGTHEIDFIATDRFKKEKKATIKLFCFDNLPPVPLLKIYPLQKESELEYLIDASESYDQDKNFGGHITSYRFKINKAIIDTSSPLVKYIFPYPGSYLISLLVKDDQGNYAEIKETIVEVQ